MFFLSLNENGQFKSVDKCFESGYNIVPETKDVPP